MKACVGVNYLPIIFAKRPHTLHGEILFGNVSTEGECPVNASKVTFSTRAGPSEEARKFLLSDNPLTDTNFCPKEVLKFSPIPTSKYCKRSNFENFTSITQYNMDLDFTNMPEWFNTYSTRLDHFISALSDRKVDSLNMNKEIHTSVNTPTDYFWLTVEVNGVNWRIYHIPFLQKIDSKYDTSHELFYDSGLKRSCSVINGMVNSFDDYLINMVEYHNKITVAENCYILLAADCSPMPEIAIFLIPSEEADLSANYGLRVHIGNNYFTFKSSNGSILENEPVYITLNDEDTSIDIRKQPYEYPTNSDFYEFRVEVNEQNILIVENKQMRSTIQFDMMNIINFEIFGVYKNKMCGLCSKPLNVMQNYTLCM